MGGPSGDLYVVIHVQEHAYFQRDGNDLYVEVPLNFSTVALGGEIRIPTLEGEEPFKIPEGTESGQAFRLRGRGMPDVTGRGRGDLFVTVKVTTPCPTSATTCSEIGTSRSFAQIVRPAGEFSCKAIWPAVPTSSWKRSRAASPLPIDSAGSSPFTRL